MAICGAELFTGNTLLTKAALQGQIPWSKIAQNWSLVLPGNLIGSLFFAWLMLHSQLWQSGSIADKAVASGFEHSVANMYDIPTGIFLADALGQSPEGPTWQDFWPA